jgi:hypothetical protein
VRWWRVCWHCFLRCRTTCGSTVNRRYGSWWWWRGSSALCRILSISRNGCWVWGRVLRPWCIWS